MKIILFPPSEVEAYFYYVDWANTLLELDVDLVLFEERYQDLVKGKNNIRDKINSLKPDLILGFDLYFMGFAQEDSVLIRPMFEPLEIPYVSILTSNWLGQVSALISSARFFRYLVGMISILEEGPLLVEKVLGRECKKIAYSYPDIKVNFEKWGVRDEVLFQNISRHERKWTFRDDFVEDRLKEIKERIKGLLNKGTKIGELMAMFGEDLAWSMVSCQVIDDAHWQWCHRLFEGMIERFDMAGLQISDKILVSGLEHVVNCLREFKGVVGERMRFSRNELDRLSWFALRVGGVPFVFETEFPDVDWWWRIREDLANLEEIVKKFSDKKVRQEVFGEMYSYLQEKSNFKESVAGILEWLEKKV